MKESMQQIVGKFAEFLLLCLILVIATGMIFLDARLWGHIPAESFVEFSQEFLILLSSALFGYLALKKDRRGLWLVCGFLGCMFIRELDEYFDLIFHGSWFYLAITYAAISIFLALREGLAKALKDLAEYMTNKYFVTMSCGMALILVYSRLIGMKLIWKIIMAENFSYYVKNVIEEGTELIGYAFIFVGSLQYAYDLCHRKES